MKYMVAAGREPWKSTYDRLVQDATSSCNYAVRGDASDSLVDVSTNHSYGKFKYDSLAAYHNALRWFISGDECHAQKAVEIFNAWSNVTHINSTGTKSLDAGRVIWKMLEGAEIIRHTYDGWSDDDIARFEAMLVYPGYSTSESFENAESRTFYWQMYNGDSQRYGNQGLFGMRGIMAMGIFLDNETMYQRALRYLEGLSHLEEDLPYPSGQRIVSANPSATNEYFDEYRPRDPYATDEIEDYGFNEQIEHYIWENGQSQESSRDQGHAIVGVSIIISMAEMAWNQDDDLYAFLDYRPLKGLEFFYRYNLSYNHRFEDQPEPWEPTAESGEFIQRRDRSGRWFSKRINPWYGSDLTRNSRGTRVYADQAPIQEMALGHYRDRLGLDQSSYKWTDRALTASIELNRPEGRSISDHPGWGGLTERRPDFSPGDPVILEGDSLVYSHHVLPGTVEAENFDDFSIGGQGRTYSDSTRENSPGQYRPNEAVDIALDGTDARFYVTKIMPGEWLGYTVNVPTDGRYRISINYASSRAGGTVQLEFDGTRVSGPVAVPCNGNANPDAGWSTLTVAESVELKAGVQRMRILFDGTSGAFELDSIVVD